MTFQEYNKLFNSEPSKIMRKILNYLEREGSYYDFEDSNEHNNIIRYFNKYKLHKKLNRENFDKYRDSISDV